MPFLIKSSENCAIKEIGHWLFPGAQFWYSGRGAVASLAELDILTVVFPNASYCCTSLNTFLVGLVTYSTG
jgi:hypothetical protein